MAKKLLWAILFSAKIYSMSWLAGGEELSIRNPWHIIHYQEHSDQKDYYVAIDHWRKCTTLTRENNKKQILERKYYEQIEREKYFRQLETAIMKSEYYFSLLPLEILKMISRHYLVQKKVI